MSKIPGQLWASDAERDLDIAWTLAIPAILWQRKHARERQFKHIVESLTAKGVPFRKAEGIAAATVNKYRAAKAKRGGTQLVGKGGSRQQWYPGKRKALGLPEVLVCLRCERTLKTRGGWKRHLQSALHRGKRP